MSPLPSALSVACSCENLQFGVASAPGLKQGGFLPHTFWHIMGFSLYGERLKQSKPFSCDFQMHNVDKASKILAFAPKTLRQIPYSTQNTENHLLTL